MIASALPVLQPARHQRDHKECRHVHGRAQGGRQDAGRVLVGRQQERHAQPRCDAFGQCCGEVCPLGNEGGEWHGPGRQHAVRIVFQEQHVSSPQNFGHLLAPRPRHGGRGGIVDRRDQVDGLGRMFSTCRIECVGEDALFVDRNADEAHVPAGRCCPYAGIGQGFGEHHISRRGKRNEQIEERILGARTDHHTVTARVGDAGTQPLGGSRSASVPPGSR